MGQPIKIYKDNEVEVVYGNAQLAVMESQGWSLEEPREGERDFPEVSEKVSLLLVDAGYTPENIGDAFVQDLTEIDGIGAATAIKLIGTIKA